MKVYNNVIELIGKTPLVKYNENIYLKLEFLNPSHSVKDRASYYMLKDAKESGKIKDNTVIIEPTSGNTGIGLAMCCAVMGLKIVIVMPENNVKFIFDDNTEIIKHWIQPSRADSWNDEMKEKARQKTMERNLNNAKGNKN